MYKYLFLLFLVSAPVFSQTEVLQQKIAEVSNNHIKNGTLSLSVLDLESEKVAFSYNAEKWLTPASSLKILTTAAAIGILGKDFRFETSFLYDGKTENGILNGNLYINGTGDPTFCSHRYNNENAIFSKIVSAISELKITTIKGKIIINNNSFTTDDIPGKWLYMDLGNYFAAETKSLNFRENFYKIYFKRSEKEGEKTTIVKTDPNFIKLDITNYVTTAAPNSPDDAYIYGSVNDKQFIKGTIPAGEGLFSIKAAMPNPENIFTEMLKQKLTEKGISVKNEELVNSEKTKIMSIFSDKLIDIVRLTNHHSINLYAESILKVIGKGDRQNGILEVHNFWKKLGINTKNLKIEDGSGLSPLSFVTTSELANALLVLKNQSFYNEFKSSLPISGESGTLKNFGKDNVLKGSFKGKSGNMDRVISYSGYLKCKSGKEVCVVLIVNNYSVDDFSMKKECEKLLIQVYEQY
jgi:serine-type D-Ala-D-Ala carboxypeptidase/endopeptidase (penicillin-binding protein 4)